MKKAKETAAENTPLVPLDEQDLKWIIYKKNIRTMYSTTIIATSSSTHYISRLLAGPK